MAVYQIDPLHDPRWVEFLERHPQASIFHTPGWLRSLQRTYGYEPFALTTAPPHSDLTNGLVFCRVKSRWVSERIVSLPFADHCDPLFERVEDIHIMLDWLSRKPAHESCKQIELRPRNGRGIGLAEHTQFRSAQAFSLHVLDLRPDLDVIANCFDRDNVQRRLRRAERENLTYEEGNTSGLLKKFYYLQVMTRRRHRIPPQPLRWFANLLDALGESAKIRVVSRAGAPVASILTLTYKDSVVYKYGNSDARRRHLAGTPLLFWKVIRAAKESNAGTFDMGRSDLDNPGLIAFKSHWGASDERLTYWRYPAASPKSSPAWSKGCRGARLLISVMPCALLALLGEAFYKYAG